MLLHLISPFIPKNVQKYLKNKKKIIFKILVRKSSRIVRNVENMSSHPIRSFIPKMFKSDEKNKEKLILIF